MKNQNAAVRLKHKPRRSFEIARRVFIAVTNGILVGPLVESKRLGISQNTLFDGELGPILGIQFSLMIGCYHA